MLKFINVLMIYCILFSAANFLANPFANAGGFEKQNLVSGKYTGLSGAATSSIEGSESVYFNPAGLAKTQGLDVTLNFALGRVYATAPLTSNGVNPNQGAVPLSNNASFIPLGAAFASYRLRENLGVGIGFFVSGGAGQDFGNVDFGTSFPALKPEFKSLFGLLETSVAMGYEPLPGLRIGAAWRILLVKSESKAGGLLAPTALLATQFTGLSGTSFNGFRFGAQYVPPSANWGIGATLRTSVRFSAKGQSSGSFENAGSQTVAPVTGGDIVLDGQFPMQLSLGAHADLNQNVRLHLQYSFTYNSAVQGLLASGSPLVVPGLGPVPASTFSVLTHWRNQHQMGPGLEWQASERWALRAGYSYATQVIPNDAASPFFSAPGSEHVFTVGAGTRVFNDSTHIDVALEYITNTGTATGSASPSLDGDYSSSSYGVFTGISRSF